MLEQLKEKPCNTMLIIAFDNDDIGRNASAEASRKLDEANIKHIVKNLTLDSCCKDVNELLSNKKEDSLRDMLASVCAEVTEDFAITKENYITKNSVAGDMSGFWLWVESGTNWF